METQKMLNLLNGSDNDNSRFATKKWYIIDSESKGNYSHENPIKFLTSSLESSLCDYSDAYILVTGNITATPNNAAFTITDAKLYVTIVTLTVEDNSKLSKLLNKGFKRSIY